MVTPRQRMLDAIHFNHPDKIPLIYHDSPAGLYVHGQKLLDLFNAHPPDNLIGFKIWTPPPEAVDDSGRYHDLGKDMWGTEWEHLIFGVSGIPKRFPFTGWEAAAGYVFPPRLSNSPYFSMLYQRNAAKEREKYLRIESGISIFERLYELQPMEEVLISLALGDKHLLAFLERLVDYWMDIIDDFLDLGADIIMFGDDWGTQSAPFVSLALFRRIFVPHYRRMFERVKRAGCKVFFHSCGYLGPIFDELLDLGIDGLWPQIKLFEQWPNAVEKCVERRVTLYIHPDRQYLVPRGTPQEIEAAIRAYADRYHALGGGGIFYIEIENDAPFENVKALIEAVDTYR